MSRVDPILDVIDAGLQTPVPDPTFGEVSPTNDGRCARCQHHDPAEDGDLCDGCRAFLLDDSDQDPKRQEPSRWSYDRWFDEVRRHQPPPDEQLRGTFTVIDEAHDWHVGQWVALTRRSAERARFSRWATAAPPPRRRHPIRCFGGPRDGHWVPYVGDVMEVPVATPVMTFRLDVDPLDPRTFDIETVRYRAERVTIGADLVYCYVSPALHRARCGNATAAKPSSPSPGVPASASPAGTRRDASHAGAASADRTSAATHHPLGQPRS